MDISCKTSSSAPESLTKWIVLKAVLRATWIFLNNFVAVPTYLVWMLLLRPMLRHPKLHSVYWWLEGILYRWMLIQVSYWSWVAGYTTVEVGDDLTPYLQDKAVLMANHQSTYDVPCLMGLFTADNKGYLGRQLCWIMDILFRFTQFGMVSKVHGDFFIQQGRDTRHLQPKLLEAHLRQVFMPRGLHWVVVFPEGGFLRKRRAASKEYGRKNGYPVLEHVTLPRVGALQTVLTTLKADTTNGSAVNGHPSEGRKSAGLKWVVDSTIAYPGGRPLDLFCVIFGHRQPCQTVVHHKVFPVDEVPTDTESLTKWMYKRYEEKERLLGEYYATGTFPCDQSSRRELRVSSAKACALQGLFLASFIFHCYVISLLVSLFCNILGFFI